jgi:hypothetical protein
MDIYHNESCYPHIRHAVARIIKDKDLDFYEIGGCGDHTWIELYLHPRMIKKFKSYSDYVQEYVRQFNILVNAVNDAANFSYNVDVMARIEDEESFLGFMKQSDDVLDTLLTEF